MDVRQKRIPRRLESGAEVTRPVTGAGTRSDPYRTADKPPLKPNRKAAGGLKVVPVEGGWVVERSCEPVFCSADWPEVVQFLTERLTVDSASSNPPAVRSVDV